MKGRMFRVFVVFVLFCCMAPAGFGRGIHALAKPEETQSEDEDGGEEEEKDDKDEEDEDDELMDELEERRQNTLGEIDSLKSDIRSVEQKIQELKNAKSDLQTYISQLDRQVNSLESQIKDLETEIEKKKEEIAQKEEELEQAQAEADAQYELMKKRICYMYEKGQDSFLVLLLESESLSDLLNRADYAMQMSDYDRKMLDQLREIREAIAEHKRLLEEEEAEQESLLEELESQKAAVDRAISVKAQEIASYQSQINNASGEQGEYEKQLQEQEKLLEQVEYQIAAAAAAKAAREDGDGGASGFLWPCPASHRITSSFGPRQAPVAGASTYHKGIDVGAASGSAILAAASGRVTTSAYSGSAGNYVVISHGNGVSTVYMHASALYVSEGQMVSQGQKIAAVGSTGFSTGPHLHFGVIVDGSYVNPLNYVH